MVYTINKWTDRQAVNPTRYKIKNASTGEETVVTITSYPESVIDEGTPVDATRLNHIEKGIKDIDDALDVLKKTVETGGGGSTSYSCTKTAAFDAINQSITQIKQDITNLKSSSGSGTGTGTIDQNKLTALENKFNQLEIDLKDAFSTVKMMVDGLRSVAELLDALKPLNRLLPMEDYRNNRFVNWGL